jgi:hypothetical protein
MAMHALNQKSYKSAWIHIVLSAILISLIIIPTFTAEAAPGALSRAAAEQPNALYLPLAQVATTTNPPPPPPPPTTEARFFLQQGKGTNRARMAVDKAGGMHIAYIDAEPGAASPAYYGYCPASSNCANPSAWQVATLSDHLSDIQLALTPAGKPRLLLELDGPSTIGAFGVVYDYAACDGTCTNAAEWQIVRVTSSSRIDVNRIDRPWRTFGVDGQGRPRFVYDKGSKSYYVECNTDCMTNPSSAPNWIETPLTLPSGGGGNIPQMTLAVTALGQPRVLGEVYTDEEPWAGLYFLACDENCTQSDQWSRVVLVPINRVVIAEHDLEITASGGLRATISLYTPETDGSPKQLYYAACDANCLDPSSWLATPVGLEKNDGELADLELDAQGRPRIAYRRSDAAGLGYIWCDNQCETDPQWVRGLADASNTLEQQIPAYEFSSCNKGLWSTGWRPTLALDPQGNPRIATDAAQIIRCFAQPEPGSRLQEGINTLWFTRLVFFKQP